MQTVSCTSVPTGDEAASFAPENLLDGDMRRGWKSNRLPVSHLFITLKFPAPVTASSLRVRWFADHAPTHVRLERGVRSVRPELVDTVEDPWFAESDATAGDLLFEPWVPSTAVAATPHSGGEHTYLEQHIPLHNTRLWGLRLYPSTGDTGATHIGAWEIALFTPCPSKLRTPHVEVLQHLQDWLMRVRNVRSTATMSLVMQAMMRTAVASGSLTACLRVVLALLPHDDDRASDDGACDGGGDGDADTGSGGGDDGHGAWRNWAEDAGLSAASRTLVKALQDQRRRAEEKLGEYLIAGGIVSGAVNAKFDASVSKPGLRLSHGARRATHTESGVCGVPPCRVVCVCVCLCV